MLHLIAFLATLTAFLASATPFQREHESPIHRAALERLPGGQCVYEPFQGDGAEDSIIHGEYVIHFSPHHTLALHQKYIGQDPYSFAKFDQHPDHNGYKAVLDDHTFHERVRRDPGVIFAENNMRVYLDDPFDVSPSAPISENLTQALDKRYVTVVDQGQPWNLRMLAAGTKLPVPVTGKGAYETLQYSGAGVNIYILDSGIRISHKSFQGRATNFQGMTWSPYANETMEDNSGHGTHVAGIAGSITHGVAKWATLVNVKVFGEDTNLWSIQRAIRDITREHEDLKKKPYSPGGYMWRGAVINMSFSMVGYEGFFLSAIKDAVNAGITITAAAGNQGEDATERRYPCAFSKKWSAVTCVAAVDNSYKKPPFSNYGYAVEVAAPGDRIESLGHNSDTETVIKSGTSMAAPHVAGILANIVYWEALNQKYDSAFYATFKMSVANSLKNIMSAFPGNRPYKFATTGINNGWKADDEPYNRAGPSPVVSNQAELASAVTDAYSGRDKFDFLTVIEELQPFREVTATGQSQPYTTLTTSVSFTLASPTTASMSEPSIPSGHITSISPNTSAIPSPSLSSG